jgi:hypothetical protein
MPFFLASCLLKNVISDCVFVYIYFFIDNIQYFAIISLEEKIRIKFYKRLIGYTGVAMNTSLTRCPVCENELLITRLHCDACDTTT